MTWNCPIKQAARKHTIPKQIKNQYWSLSSPEEYYWARDTGRTDTTRFHGVEIDPVTYDRNIQDCPEATWHLGDLYEVMEDHYDRGDLDPSFVNVDLFQGVETSAAYVSNILRLVTGFECTVLANFVMKHRIVDDTPQRILNRLQQEPMFRAAYRDGWRWDDDYYQYSRQYTTMCSLTFHLTK